MYRFKEDSIMLRFAVTISLLSLFFTAGEANELKAAIKSDYDTYLAQLFDHFHQNPELSLLEIETAARMAIELRATGFDVTENIGGTGLVAILKNGAGPLVMMLSLIHI